MVSCRPVPAVARSRRAWTVSFVELPCRRYQPWGVPRALPWRVAPRRSGSLMVSGVRAGCSGSGGVRQGGQLRSGAFTSMSERYSAGWLGWALPSGLLGEGRVVLRCPRCLSRGGICGGPSSGAR